jgi:DNA-binding beta-propeller fold protein YncE
MMLPFALRRAAVSALLILPLLFTACDSTTDTGCEGGADDCLPPPATVFVGNQGNFTDGDGSVTTYDPESDAAAEPIGDFGAIVQSIATDGQNLYVAANTGGRVDVYRLDTESGLSDGRIGQIPVENPRYLAFTEDKVFVTSQLYDRPSEVVVADAATFEVVATVEVGGFAEGIAVRGDRVFVATGAFGATQEVVVLDAATNEVVQRIDVGCTAPRSLVADSFGAEVWVFCAGAPATDDAPEVEGEVVVLDAATGEVVTRIAIDGRIDTAGPGQDAFARGVSIFAVRDQDTVLRFDAEANTLAATIPAAGDPIGAVAFDDRAERLYLGRVAGFDVAGSVTIHEADGTQAGVFTAGVAPTSILVP